MFRKESKTERGSVSTTQLINDSIQIFLENYKDDAFRNMVHL
jgi:hypothetical protein